MVINDLPIISNYSDGLARMAVEILWFFSLKNQRLQRTAGDSS